MSGDLAFVGAVLDRADHVRSNPAELERLMTEQARLLMLDGLDPLVSEEGALTWRGLEKTDADGDAELVFLGLLAGQGCFARVPDPSQGSTAPPRPGLWQAVASLSSADLATYGGARSLVDWHARHRFCARCGAGTVLAKGGWQRNCINPDCPAEHFPRVDPVTIMLVECDGKLLLGRQPRFPEGNYSALAGFVEPGEAIEEAVAREVHEEAGVRVRDVTYVMSQPWPFPSSLMIACHSYADDPALTIDRTELDDARWFSRGDVAEAMAAVARGDRGKAFNSPPRMAVAHHLLRWWLQRQNGAGSDQSQPRELAGQL